MYAKDYSKKGGSMDLEDKIIMDKYAIGEIKPPEPPPEPEEEHLSDVYTNNNGDNYTTIGAYRVT